MEERVDLDEDDFESEIQLADYDVVPRPQELIQMDTKISSKSVGKSELGVFKPRSVLPGPSRDFGERATSRDFSKKFVSRVQEKRATSQELSKKFESHVHEAKKMLNRYRYNKSEPSNEESGQHRLRLSSPVIEQSSPEQNISNAMRRPAYAAQERYDALNNQDSEIRNKEAKKGEPKSKVINGTCPDMCPEKERYSRIAKNCLSVFELEKGLDPKSNSKEVNHRYMIKEYTRSSADQQEPLPHELRPVPVLKFTMDYLICNIIDKINNNISVEDWFDFIWNRTRSIRKDITQQQLCDVESVDILEKCARFHVLCAELLAEKDTMTFDPRINNENLNKCLQTLKHMYHDLQTKGVLCSNEAEFRAYDILLSMNEGETLRIVKDFRKEVFRSPLVKSAFEAALALKSNNYVKFFKLFENAPYLCRCIMHRYIHEARVSAVKVIIRAYSLQNSHTFLPLSRLVRDLKFQSNQDAATFCRWHGLEVDETLVKIQRQSFQRPTEAYPVSRVASLVEIQRNIGLGMIINNGPLPENPLNWYVPQNSFDDGCVLREDTVLPTTKLPDLTGPEEVEDSDSDSMDCEIIPATQPTASRTVDSPKSELSSFKGNTSEGFEKLISQSATKRIHDSQKQPKTDSFSFDNSKDCEIIPVTKTVDSPKSELSSFKKTTIDGFEQLLQQAAKCIRDSQKQPKTDSFSFFCDDTPKSNSSKIKPQNEGFSFVDTPQTSSLKESFVSSTPQASSTKIFQTPGVVSPSMRMENIPTTKFQTFNVPQDSSKTFSFKSPLIFAEKSPFIKTSSESESLSFFSQPRKEINIGENANLVHSSFKQPSSASESRTTIASKPEVTNTFGATSYLKSMASQQDLHKICDFQDQEPELEIVFSTMPKHVQSSKAPTIQDNYQPPTVKEPVLLHDTPTIDEIFLDDSESDQDSTEEDNSHMSMENDETLKRLRNEKIDELILNVEEEVYSQCIKELSSGICKKTIDEEWEIKNNMDASLETMRLFLAQKAVYKWKLFCERKKQRNIYKNFVPLSPWLPMLMNAKYVTSGATSPFTVYKKHCCVSRLADSKLKEMEAKPGWEPLEDSHFELLNNQPPVPPAYLQTTGIVRYFKLGIVFVKYPDDAISYFMEWMCKKFKLPEFPDANINKEMFSSFYTLNGGKTVISVQAIVLGLENIGDCSGFMNGMSAMILCCPTRFPDMMPFEAFLDKFSILLKEANLLSAFPLFTFALEANQEHNVLNALSSFLNERVHPGGCFSSVNLDHMQVRSGYTKNSTEVVKAIKWLIGNQEPRPCLLSAVLENYIWNSNASAFNVIFRKLSVKQFKPLLMLPQHIITFYNKMLDARADLLCSEYLLAVSESWPPPELLILQPGFRNIDKSFQKKAADLIKSLHLPEFTGDSITPEDVWRYVRKIGGLSGNDAMLFIDIQRILQAHSDINWPLIINKCAKYIICGNCSNLTDKMKSNVYYMKEEFQSIGSFEDYWLSLLSSLKEQHSERKKEKLVKLLAKSFQKKRKAVEKEDYEKDVSMASSIPDATSCHVEDKLSSLKSALKKQKEESDKFDFKLNESVSDVFTEKELEQSFDKDLISKEQPAVTPIKSHDVESLFFKSMKPTTGILTTGGANSWDKFIGKKSTVTHLTSSSLSDKISELRYNIQKNNVLEDNLSSLLDLG